MSVALEAAVVVERSVPMAGAVELVVHHPPSASAVSPGQFFQLAVNAPHTILRRPYSAAWSDPASGRIGFIFNVVGAGGLGVAVFPGVVQALVARGRKVTMLQGARTQAQLLPSTRFPGADVQMATEDGSAGHRGSVVDLLSSLPPPQGEGQGGGVEVFACGPTPMLKALIDVARQKAIPFSAIQVALETPMGCGVGTCLGCAAPPSEGGYLLTCQDGPCVRADRIDWDRMSDGFHA